jgi:alkanesulfonate monooxygenase SsuD/methylene tetrahydromethanopterin reductase-like flavin-dependent oxidoreductase (luciferase family)
LGHLATTNLPGHYIGLIILISAEVQPPSVEFGRQYTWANYDVENFQESPIWTTRLKGEFNRESQCIIVQIGEPERVLETLEEQFKELADVLLNDNS